MIKFVEFNEIFLESSWGWLNDPEIRLLTDTPDFTKDQQYLWYKGLSRRDDYLVFGVMEDSSPIGVVGLKNINKNKGQAEYFGYIGEKKYWGKGIGTLMMKKMEIIAKEKYNLSEIVLYVITENLRAIKLYRKMGYCQNESFDRYGKIFMIKKLK
jgi:RimJ/RimL family protein N-acetyltransferase